MALREAERAISWEDRACRDETLALEKNGVLEFAGAATQKLKSRFSQMFIFKCRDIRCASLSS
jgi:hypothetical protein